MPKINMPMKRFVSIVRSTLAVRMSGVLEIYKKILLSEVSICIQTSELRTKKKLKL